MTVGTPRRISPAHGFVTPVPPFLLVGLSTHSRLRFASFFSPFRFFFSILLSYYFFSVFVALFVSLLRFTLVKSTPLAREIQESNCKEKRNRPPAHAKAVQYFKTQMKPRTKTSDERTRADKKSGPKIGKRKEREREGERGMSTIMTFQKRRRRKL